MILTFLCIYLITQLGVSPKFIMQKTSTPIWITVHYLAPPHFVQCATVCKTASNSPCQIKLTMCRVTSLTLLLRVLLHTDYEESIIKNLYYK